MPVTTTYPGLYIEELPSTSHTITPAPTSIAVFVGYTHPLKTLKPSQPVPCFSFTDYLTNFGGFIFNHYYPGYRADGYSKPGPWDSFGSVAHAVNQFFLNGGSNCYVVGLIPSGGVTAPALYVPLSPGTSSSGSSSSGSGSGSPGSGTGSGGSGTGSGGSGTGSGGSGTGSGGSGTGSGGSGTGSGGSGTGSGGSSPSTPTPITPTSTAPASPPYVQFTAIECTDDDWKITLAISNLAFSSLNTNQSYYDAADITITYAPTKNTSGTSPGAVYEKYRGVSLIPNLPSGASNPNYISNVIGTSTSPVSALVTVAVTPPSPSSTAPLAFSGTSPATAFGNLFPVGAAGTPSDIATSFFSAGDFNAVFLTNSPLDKLAIFNLLVLPGVSHPGVLGNASAFCEKKFAFFIIDPPPPDLISADGYNQNGKPTPSVPLISDWVNHNITSPSTLAGPPIDKNCALYFPYIQTSDPITGGEVDLPPSGTVAGIFAREDQNRGVWKAPAGLETTITNSLGVVINGQMNNPQQGVLNPLGVNCLRDFTGSGTVVFGARTLVTNDPAQSSLWRYVPVRRMALFIEQTLMSNLTWVVFEPNDEPLWNAIVSSVSAFMLSLFRQQAFQGSTPSDAFQVVCDSTTTTQTDIDNGVVNILVAFAPLKPAEFVVIQIAQLAGQSSTS
jgi:hypothetical protein